MARRSKLAALSLADLRREIARRERGSKALLRKRARSAAKLHALGARIAALGLAAHARGSGAVPGGKRPKNKAGLVEALRAPLKGKTLGVGQAMEAVQKAGYRTVARNFRVIVNGALINSGNLKRVERGQYTAK